MLNRCYCCDSIKEEVNSMNNPSNNSQIIYICKECSDNNSFLSKLIYNYKSVQLDFQFAYVQILKEARKVNQLKQGIFNDSAR